MRFTPSNPKPSSASYSIGRDWLLPAIVTAVAYVVLFFIIPYSEGYLGGRQPVLRTAYAFWTGYEDWEHGMLVPALVVVIIWLQRRHLATVPIRGSNWGLLVILPSLLIYWLGFVVDHHYIGFISAQLLIAGLIIWFLGWRMMQALLFPWAFLGFTWPFLFLDSVIAFPLRMLLSNLAFHFLNGIGLAAVKIGSAVVSAPNPQLQIPAAELFAIDIADPCSGIRSLFALMMVSALYAHFAVTGFWKKWIVFAAAVPFAILGNFVRILLLVFGSIIFGAEFAIGSLEDPTFYHMAAGFLVFAVALGAMIGLTKLLDLNWRELASNVRNSTARISTPTTPTQDKKSISEPDLY